MENRVELNSVMIGKQIWMAENLNVNHYRNGDEIPHGSTDEEWLRYCSKGIGCWCYYDNKPSNGTKYGRLYNWYALKDKRNLAPIGWHIANDAEWAVLTNYLGGEVIAGKKMKSTEGWLNNGYGGGVENGNGNNVSGFNGLPSGLRDSKGFGQLGEIGVFWSCAKGWFKPFTWWNCSRSLMYCFHTVYRAENWQMAAGLAIRCIRD
jgi:uncharacterized protein (TIGR02145 family)